MPEKVTSIETRIIRVGLSILTILGFVAYFVREVWHIVNTFLHQ